MPKARRKTSRRQEAAVVDDQAQEVPSTRVTDAPTALSDSQLETRVEKLAVNILPLLTPRNKPEPKDSDYLQMMENNHHKLSTHLCAVLDNVGASEDVRQLFWETSMALEIAPTFLSHFVVPDRRTSFYCFGSSCEGTTTLGLRSDRDMLICAEYTPVIDSIIDVSQILCYRMVRDYNIKPGYVQLQQVVHGIQLCNYLRPAIHCKEEFDEYGATCLMHPQERRETLEKVGSIPTTINGPAVTFINGEISSDSVYALRCQTVPSFANSWINRTRKYDWPSQKQIQTMKSFGCFLVGVAHPHSNNKSIEWRISFSLQERELMSDLNPTQHKCYILLKMIKKDLIEPRTGKSISSYHCKTCLFYTIETSESSIWTQENLILCTRMCLVRLLNWSKNGNCPNYFIPEENMFDRLDKQTLEIVNTELTYILSNGLKFLSRLECDNIGQRLLVNLAGLPHNKEGTYDSIEFMLNMAVVQANFLIRNRCLQNNVSIYILQRFLTHLQETNHVTEHSKGDVRIALSNIVPHIHLQIAQSLTSVEIRRRGTTTNDLLPLDILLNIIDSSASSSFSARLSLAAFYLQFGMLEACEQLLLTVETSLNPYVRSVCICYIAQYLENITHEMKLVTESYNITTETFIDTYTTGCLVFLQSQANIVHPALQYEWYRSVYTAVGSRNEDIDFWFDFVVVDPKVYLYFLQYIFCTKTNKPVHRRRIVETFQSIMNTKEKYLVHWETAYNVFGWMLIQENRAIEAWQCFCRSWRIKPFQNAAKWHIILLLNNLLR